MFSSRIRLSISAATGDMKFPGSSCVIRTKREERIVDVVADPTLFHLDESRFFKEKVRYQEVPYSKDIS